MCAEAPAGPGELALVCFQDGGYRFAMEAKRVLTKRAAPAGPDGTGGPEPVPPGGGQAENAGAILVISLASGETRARAVGEPVELVSLPGSAVHPLPVLLSLVCRIPGLRALGFDRQGIIFILEPQ